MTLFIYEYNILMRLKLAMEWDLLTALAEQNKLPPEASIFIAKTQATKEA